MSLSTASILLHAFLLLTLLLAAMVSGAATTSIPVEHGDLNTTTTLTNSSAATTSPDDNENFEMYYCFLCTGRYPLLIHRCPIYWDYCHLICDYPPTTAAVDAAAIPSMAMATTAPPAAPVSPSPSLGSALAHPTVQGGDDCYVMKRYMSGRYVIVQRLPCKYAAWCFLTCGGGELDDRNIIMGTAATAAIQGSFLPVDDDAELCGTQVNAPWAPPEAGGGGVPAGGAHRRR